MISYIAASSPFYFANKNYCEAISQSFGEHDISFSGYCDSWGYEIKSAFEHGKINYQIECLKYQITQGSHSYHNSTVHEITVLNASGFDRNIKFKLGKGMLRRWMMSKELKGKVEAPFYLVHKQIDDAVITKILASIHDKEIAFMSLQNGKLKIKFHEAVKLSVNFIYELENYLNRP